ncbi:MAG: hypothetical protein KKE89_04805 [Actinobacteria bacterium]|nr:hypothetical protein [Actinomycetota bacterium]
MLIGVVLGLAVALGAPWQAVAAAGLAVLHPGWFLAGVVVWVIVRARRGSGPGPEDESAFLRGLAAELSAGASLRGAVVAAAGRAPALGLNRAVRLCTAGRPAEEIGAALGEVLEINRVGTAAAFRLASRTGGAIAPVVESLAMRAEAAGRLARERAALTAQARLSAWLVGGVPVALILLGLATGIGPGAGGLGPGGLVLVGIGLALIAAGSLVVVAMVRRAER